MLASFQQIAFSLTEKKPKNINYQFPSSKYLHDRMNFFTKKKTVLFKKNRENTFQEKHLPTLKAGLALLTFLKHVDLLIPKNNFL